MARTRVVLRSAGFRALLLGPEVQGDLHRRGEAIAAAAGPGHVVRDQPSANRARVAVFTQTNTAKRAEAEDRNLTRAMDAGR